MEGLHGCLVLSGVTIKLKKSENPWVRPQEMERKLTKEEKKTAELYRLVLAILNKLTPQRFRTLVIQMMQLDIDTPERLEGVVDRIVEKAISESMYSLAYANMCRCLFLIKVSGPDEGDVTFRKLLLGRCQKEFEKEREDENAFLKKHLSQLEEHSEKEKKIKKKEMGEEAAKNKRRMFGNFKFLGELFNLKLLTENIIHDCVFKLLRDGDEESLQCMCALLFKIGKKLDSDRAKPRIDQYFEQINRITSRKNISPGICLMLRYLVDLRKDDWIPRGRKEDFEPKTINQIHKEAQMERSQERRDVNTGGGLRDSPKLMAASGDDWTNLTVLPSEFDELTKLLSGQTVTNDIELKKSENPWVRPQERESELTKDEKKTAELYRVVVAILNKLTPQKFKTLVEKIMNLHINTPERLEGVVDRIFEKAISEPMYSVAYANMCRCLFPIKVSSPDENDVTFRKLLLNRCQKEFERERENEKAFLEKQSQLEGLSAEERKIKKEELEEEVAKKLRRQLGNIKFIGELFKLKLLTENIMHDCVFKFLRAGDEESLQCMCTLLYNIGKDLDSEKAKPRIEQYFEQINKNISGKKVSARIRCMLRDLVDLRKNNWIPRRKLNEDFNPKTIDQIRKEAQMERLQKQRNAKLSQSTGKQRDGRSRDSPKPMATSGDGWMVTGRSGKPVAIDHNELKGMAGKITSNVQVETTKSTKEDMIQEKRSLSKAEFIRKTKAIVEEFVNIEDLEEACRCFTDLHSPQLHHVFVTTAIELTYEMDAKARKVTGRLINALLPNLLRKEQFRMGLNNVLENAEDQATDYPKLWRYLADILTPVIMRGNFSLSDLKPLIIMHVVQCNKAAVFLAEILVLVAKEYDENKAILLWTDSNISWSEVLPNDATVDEFLLQNNLTFLPSGVDELTKLLSGEIVTNDTDAVFVFIEKNFKEDKRKEPAFISHLASVVAESCIIEKDGMDGPDCSTEKLKARKNILLKYLDNNHDLEVEVLFALQALFVRHNKPSRMLSSFFNTLYDEEVITEDSFLSWKSDENPAKQEGKGPALQSTASFFEWIQSAVVEGNEY